MPQKNLPPDYLAYYISIILTGIAGAFGALVRQIHGPQRKVTQRLLEWLAGALCAIYGAEIVAIALFHSLEKFDFIGQNTAVPEKIIGLAGFLCGALGISIIENLIALIKRHTDMQ